MKSSKAISRILWGLAGLLVFALLAAATLPVWFRWVLRPVLSRYGIQYERYQAIGYTRFAIVGVRGASRGVSFQSARVEAPLPTRWPGPLHSDEDQGQAGVQCVDWQLHFLSSGATASGPASAPVSTFGLLEGGETVVRQLRRWLPAARLTNGLVAWNDGHGRALLPSAEWSRGWLTATVLPPGGNETIQVRADLSRDGAHSLSLSTAKSGLGVAMNLVRAADAWEFGGHVVGSSNRLEVTSRFVGRGWWPHEARITGGPIGVPASLLRVEGFEDLSVSVNFRSTEDRFTLDGSVRGRPKPGAPRGVPAVALALQAHGDAQTAFVDKLELTAPGIRADLSHPVGVARSGRLLTGSATLKVSLDLRKLPWSSMTGAMQGVVRIGEGPGGTLRAGFDLTGTDLTREDVTVKHLELAGLLNWPALELRRVGLRLADSSTFAGSARIDLSARTINEGRWRFQGRLPSAWLPEGLSYSSLQTTGRFSGPLARPTHEGQLDVEQFSHLRLKPGHVRADWRGESFELERLQLEFSAGESRLALNGAARLSRATDQPSSVVLNTLVFQHGTQTVYALQRPCGLSIRQPTGTQPGWHATLDELHWTGAGRDITLAGAVEWPRRGRLSSRWHGVALEDFADCVPWPTRTCLVSNLEFTARWDNGPVDFDLKTSIASSTGEGVSFSAQARLRGAPGGLTIEPLTVSGSSTEVVSLRGIIPVTIVPGHSNGIVHWNERKQIELKGGLAPSPPFWDGLAAFSGLRLVNPRMDVALRGTLAQPQGLLRLQAGRVSWTSTPTRLALPLLENLNVEAEFERTRVGLKTFSVELEGQPVRAAGECPLTTASWADLLRKGELPDWRRASGRLEVVDARLEVFAKYIPEILDPRGRLSLDVAVRPGAKLEGTLQFTNAATRPLMSLGHIHDIEGQVTFSDHAATIERCSGRIGGQAVSLTGKARLLPAGGFSVAGSLLGTNVPLVREPGVLLRSDLAIQFEQTSGRPATLSGEVVVHDSLFLQDLKALVVGGPTQPALRPPYFSVDEEPFAAWQLNVRIRGEKALRVHTPLFHGDISASFHLGGSMKDPVALGEATLGPARVLFPFGILTVDQGSVALRSENPYRPVLFLTASGRIYGFTVRMDVTGPADKPKIGFSSTPPLSSEEIVLMLTAGELPHSDVTLSSQQRATRLAMFLGKDFLSRLLGGEAASDRLTVRSGESLTEEGKATYSVEYRLIRDWSVVGEYDRFNALNAGLKWKVFSK